MSWRSTRAAGGTAHRRVAVIDLGSNSWRLVVFTYVPGRWWKRTDELYELVRIGEGLGASGHLSEEAIQRGLETLAVFARFCRANELGSGDVHAIATSAIRDAANCEDFVERARASCGLEIEVLSAQDEARYGYLAAVNTTTLSDGAVLELGGGSLQLIQVARRQAKQMASYPLGAMRLSERFLTGAGPAKKKELQRVREHVRASLRELEWLDRAEPRLIGVGGAVRNLAAAALRRQQAQDFGVQGFLVSAEAIAELVQMLAALPASERGSIPGIKPGRGDIILAAALTLQTVVELGSFAGIEVTEAGMREGLFFGRTLLDRADPLFEDVRATAVRNLAIQYEPDMVHSEHVARLALQLHDSLVNAALFKAAADERELLWSAAMLHDVGMTISYDDHHKHSHYVIVSAGLPGFDPRERALIAQISRYHRKGSPKLGELGSLARDQDEQLLERCSIILRLAEHLERGHDQSVSAARLRINGSGVDLHLDAAGDLTLPRWSVERYGDDEAFQRAFGRRLVIG